MIRSPRTNRNSESCIPEGHRHHRLTVITTRVASQDSITRLCASCMIRSPRTNSNESRSPKGQHHQAICFVHDSVIIYYSLKGQHYQAICFMHDSVIIYYSLKGQQHQAICFMHDSVTMYYSLKGQHHQAICFMHDSVIIYYSLKGHHQAIRSHYIIALKGSITKLSASCTIRS